ncbi:MULTISPECIES: hypothetical protein [unclassified Lentimicrobium]|uniref:hypothetical protein n=1 Tax=unclassified Lentimicrobium TaxID=2677434 RepID=UPI00155256A6|nr:MULTISPECIES: hypothetical protein [unclassified Lentimicrobium]NPD46495.1 hypothetical protein [Lentimicrobium sp. S6]NPD86001.1 hypothetical protein [Lentimicrobium sp. L6]
MLLSLFKKTYFVQISGIIIFAIVMAIPGFFQDKTAFWPDNTLFLKVSCLHPSLQINWLYQGLQFALLLTLAFFVKLLFTRHQLVHHLNFIPSLLIIALFSFQQPFEYQLINTISLFLLAFAFSFLLNGFDDDKPDNSLFTASLFISLSSFLSYSNVYFIILVWLSFFVFQIYSWRYFPITLVGLITPYLFFFTWLYWNDKLHLVLIEWDQILDQLIVLPKIDSLVHIFIFSILGFLILLSLAKIIPEAPGKIIAIRKKISISLWFLFISLFPFIWSPDIISRNIILIPVAGLVGYYLKTVKTRKFWVDLVFTIFILLLIFNKYYLAYAERIFLN